MTSSILNSNQVSVLNNYIYTNKSELDQRLDTLSFPLRTALGGTTINMNTGEISQDPSVLERIIYLALSIILFPVGIVGGACLLIKSVNFLPPSFESSSAASSSSTLQQSQPTGPVIGHFERAMNEVQINIHSPNKQYVYDALTDGRPVNDNVSITKYDFSPNSTMLLHSENELSIETREGNFAYDTSDEQRAHWTANFADRHLLGFCQGGLLAQDELLAAEHPALTHLKVAIEGTDMAHLNNNEVVLIEGAKRYGSLDTDRSVGGFTLYGNNFARATTDQINQCLERFDQPIESKIFAMVAPRIPANLRNQPYQREHLQQLFDRAYNAFKAAKVQSEGREVVIHTGNWGAGAFGNSAKAAQLMQLAAAHAAGVDEILFYPRMADFNEARQLWDTLSHHNTVEDFLTDVTNNAEQYGLHYCIGNGT